MRNTNQRQRNLQRRPRAWWVIALLLTAVALSLLTLAACGSDPTPTSQPTATAVPTGPESAQPTATAVPTGPEPAQPTATTAVPTGPGTGSHVSYRDREIRRHLETRDGLRAHDL